MIAFGQRRIATPWRQRGFFLNPARFGGSVFQGRLSVSAASSATFGGAAIASAAASAEGTSQLILSDDQLGAGAFSAGGESVATFGGAAIASAAASMAGESGLTMSMAAPITVCDAADFDGTNDYMRRGAGLTGAADAKTGILSVWVRLDGGNSADNAILVGATTLGGAGSRFFASRNASNKFDLLVTSSAGALVLWMNTAGSYTASATWRHVLMSWDASTGAEDLYINDVSDKTVNSSSNANADYTLADWSVGAQANGAFKFNGAIAELYFAPGQYLDFSVENNRRRFISADGKPIQLGPTGTNPTGTAPLVYLHLDDGETANNFAGNAGTGGNFTITGSLDTASSSPSD